MTRSVAAVLMVAFPSATTATATALPLAMDAFRSWAQEHGRAYLSEQEELRRFEWFQANMEKLAEAARASPLASFAAGEWADWSPSELAALRGGVVSEVPADIPRVTFSAEDRKAAMEAGEIDWVARGAVTTPTSQGRCATCSYFAGVAATEGAWVVAGNPLVKLSEQEEIDCFNNAGYALPNIQKHGIARAADAPLANHSDPNITGCRHVTNCSYAEAKAFARIDGLRAPASHDDPDVLALLRLGPMAVSLWSGAYNGYHGGILNCSATSPYHVDHANTLVGYGLEVPPQRCAQQPANESFATYCETSWTGRKWWPTVVAADIEECCAACAAIAGNGTWNQPACGAAVFENGECRLMATERTGHHYGGMPLPRKTAMTCIPYQRAPVSEKPIPYWKVKNSWGPTFGEGGYARLRMPVCGSNQTLE